MQTKVLRFGTFLATVTILTAIVYAQYDRAPNNYYPYSYAGSIFRGVVVETTETEITLVFTKGNKTETFTGRFETGCSVPATDGRRMMPGDVPKGTVMTAFFNATTKKVEGKKVKENTIIAISFEVWQGQKVVEDKKKIYWCTDDRQFHFRAYQ